MTWAVELGEYDIRYKPRTVIKGQALAIFVTEFGFTSDYTEEEENLEQIGLEIKTPIWALYVDGSSMNERSEAGLILTSPKGFVIQ